MRKALKTLLKGDIIKEKLRRIKEMSTKEQEFTLNQVSVLMWVKALNDFKNPDCPNDTLDDKIEKFDNETANIDIDTFKDGLEKMCSIGVLELSGEEQVYQLTANGKALMAALSAAKGFSDETMKKILNGTIKMVDFVKEHKSEILSIILTIIFKN